MQKKNKNLKENIQKLQIQIDNQATKNSRIVRQNVAKTKSPSGNNTKVLLHKTKTMILA